MPKQTELFLSRAYKTYGTSFVNADGITLKTLYTAGVDDSRIISIFVTSNDTVANDLFYYLDNGTAGFAIGHCDVPPLAGTDGITRQINGLDPILGLSSLVIDANGNRFLVLPAGWALRAGMRVAIAATRKVDVVAIGEDY